MKAYAGARGLVGGAIWLLLGVWSAAMAWAQEPSVYVWQEAEAPAAANFEFSTGAGRSHLVSGGKWLHKAIDVESVQAQLPPGGFALRYDLRIPEAGRYEVWARVGLEWARAPFEWRIGQSQWQEAPCDAQTTNVMELSEWNELAWLRLGELDLEAGPTSLEIRYTKPNPSGRMLIALDCFALTKGRFVPEGRLKPGERYDGELDRQAAAHVFQFPEAQGDGARTELKLDGPWEVARYDDEDMDKDTYVPVQALPAPEIYPLRWMGIRVPSSLWNKDETIFAHRVIYRTRVNVPASHRGRGFYLHFSGTNWIVSVFINGRLAGTHRGVWIPWDLDVSQFVQPGAVNEIAVAVKGCYYAIDAKHMARAESPLSSTVDYWRNRPRSRAEWVFWVAPIYPSTKGDGNGLDYGIVNPVTLVATGDAYVEDVFIKPSVAEKRLTCDVTLRNTSGRGRRLEVLCEAVYDRTGQVEKAFGPAEVEVPAGGTAALTVAGEWAAPKLWWPEPNPHLYRLRTTVREGGRPLDVQEELFGFREVSIKGTGIYINGVRHNVWCWVDVHGRPWTGEEWAKRFRQEGNRFIRFARDNKTSAFLPAREDQLEFYDRNGIAGRLCSMIDGMFISRILGERTNQTDPQTGRRVLIPNQMVWDGFKEHMDQLTRAYRNHPCVIFYQVENELVYITGMNVYGAYLDTVEELMNEVVEVARKNDPTRPYTVGGAGDLSGKLEINSPHYPEGSLDWYPENAYTIERYATKITRWPWDRTKPWVVGESCFANHLLYGSYVMGDEAFRSEEDAQRCKAAFLRMLYGGYRWAGVAGFFPWDNLWQYEDSQKIFSPLYVVPRRQTSRLYAGRTGSLLFKVLNDTFSSEPVIFEWSYEVDGQKIAGERQSLNIEPGFGQEVTLAIPAPQAERRLDGFLTLKVSQPGAQDYEDRRLVPVLPAVRRLNLDLPIVLLDRSGKVEAFLREVGAGFEKIERLSESRGKSGLLIVGPDTLTPEEAFGQDILAFAALGGRVVVLEQDVPVGGANLPVPLRPTTHTGGYAHPQGLGMAVFRDLGKQDLVDWAGGHPTYKNVYEKPAGGARSLVECGPMLPYSALVEVPVGKGVIVLCSLRVGANLGVDPAADVLLRNMAEFYGGYAPASGVAAIYAPGSPLLVENVRATGLLVEVVPTLEAALDPARYKAAVIHASEENLAALNGLKPKALAFQDAGCWIVLNGLDPKGIDEFNQFLGTNHMIRPFRLERVTMENPQYPLAATLGNRDVGLLSGVVLQHSKIWVADNTFSFVIDGLDAAPFTQPPGAPEDILIYEPTRNDRDPYNFVNGLTSTDHWRYIRQIWVPETGAEPLVFKFRRPERIKQVNIWNNAAYWTIADMDIIVDGDEKNAVRVTLPDDAALTEVKFPEPVTVRQSITLQIRSWRENRPDRPDTRLVGIDNVQFLRAEPPPGAVFIDSVGGLVAFPRGRGGVFLNQVLFVEDEPNKENIGKKRNLMSVTLQNMGVGSRAAEAVALPGINVRYETVDITDHCTQYLAAHGARPGWFGDRNRDMRNLKVGEQRLANVVYHIVDYSTAPVPDCIVVGAERREADIPQRVEGIKIGGRRADLLFFLHTANVRRPVTDEERARMGDRRNPFVLPELLKYVIHYADGKTAEVPVLLEQGIDHWLQEKPRPLEGAQIAVTVDVPNAPAGTKGVLYSMQVPNPRPDVPIETIDVVAGQNAQRGACAVLAITLGTVMK